MFKSKPTEKISEILKKVWKNLGPIDMKLWIKEGLTKFDSKKEMKTEIGNEIFKKG
jgi:hypothetical protein